MSTLEHSLQILEGDHWVDHERGRVRLYRTHPVLTTLWEGEPCDLAREFEELEKEIEGLQPIVDKLPKTVDGVPLRIGMDVWLTDDKTPRCCMVADATLQGVAHLLFHGATDGPHDIETLYSTREAAEAGGK